MVESGPVVYDDGAAEDEEDEDEPCVSAMELLGGNGQFKPIKSQRVLLQFIYLRVFSLILILLLTNFKNETCSLFVGAFFDYF